MKNLNPPPRHQDAKKDGVKDGILEFFLASWRLGGLFFLAFLFCWGSAGSAVEEGVALKYTYRADQAMIVPLRDMKGKTYLPLMEMAQFYGLQVEFDPQTRRITLAKGKTQIKMVLSQPVFLTTDPEGSFPMEPAEVVGGQMGVTPESAQDLLMAILNVNVRYLSDQRSLVAGGIKDDELKQEILAKPEVPAPAVAVLKPTSTPVKPAPPADEEIVDQPAVHPVRNAAAIGSDMPDKFRIKRIVIDAGHGGYDSGAKSHDKRYLEKQATLDIAHKVAELLEGKDIEILMTRKDDRYVALKQRTEFANRHEADLFVSIHCNANPKKDAYGTEIYVFNSKASNKLAAVAAARENSMDYTNSILLDLHNSIYNRQSYTLGTEVEQRVRERLGQHIRRIQQAPFYVLGRVDMPSVLIETAFISNPKEEAKLRDPYWREKIAKAIADGIVAYRDRVDGIVKYKPIRRTHDKRQVRR